ncbi:MAG: hypothetical protein ACPG5Z_00360 [Pseudoalteromonas sp.]
MAQYHVVKQYFFTGAQVAEILKAPPFRITFDGDEVFSFRRDTRELENIIFIAASPVTRTRVTEVNKRIWIFTKTELVTFLNNTYSANLPVDSKINLTPKSFLNGRPNEFWLIITNDDTSDFIQGL